MQLVYSLFWWSNGAKFLGGNCFVIRSNIMAYFLQNLRSEPFSSPYTDRAFRRFQIIKFYFIMRWVISSVVHIIIPLSKFFYRGVKLFKRFKRDCCSWQMIQIESLVLIIFISNRWCAILPLAMLVIAVSMMIFQCFQVNPISTVFRSTLIQTEMNFFAEFSIEVYFGYAPCYP